MTSPPPSTSGSRPTRAAPPGTFRLTQKGSGVALEMTEFGQLQTAPAWASFTGRARLRPSEPERAVTVILDGDDLIVRAGDVSFSTEKQR